MRTGPDPQSSTSLNIWTSCLICRVNLHIGFFEHAFCKPLLQQSLFFVVSNVKDTYSFCRIFFFFRSRKCKSRDAKLINGQATNRRLMPGWKPSGTFKTHEHTSLDAALLCFPTIKA
ncbi:Protein of unknown function [Pyronema omphalodes CBS 100304]|uniref:Uncharacterized protein n=1 Tax=Pyronema omphalodes (strain CBS 100304) TaxID=1076935 RepID=U4LF59_PYROM|nr:Protein of unknown function [Pyronema omphalodes CBS 100304]